jgi:tetratricopeptide (TPR) repeat protein
MKIARRSVWRVAVTCLIVTIVMAGVVNHRPAAAEGWNKVESKHFVVVGDVGANQLATVAQVLEQFRLASARIVPSRRVESARPTIVVVFDGNAIRPYAPRYKGRVRDVAGYFSRRSDRNFLVMRSDAFGSGRFGVVLHEYQHLVTSENMRNAPLWLSEGLSEFYSTFRADSNGRVYEIGRPVLEHVRTLRNAAFVKLEDLFSADHRSPLYNDGSRVHVFYAQSWAFVHFCLLGDERKWNDPFTRFVQGIAGGRSPVEAFRQEFGPDTTAFERRFQNYIRRYLLPAMRVTFDESVEPSRANERSRLSVEETEYIKARLANSPEGFEKRLAASLAANPTYRPALVLKGESLLNSGAWAEAANQLAATVVADRSDPRACALAMHALNLVARHESALEMCGIPSGESVELAFERGVALEALKRDVEAEDHFRIATRPSETPPEVYGRAWKYLEAGQWMAAARAVAILLNRTDIDAEFMAYARFARYLGLLFAGQGAAARAEMQALPLDARASGWPHAVFGYLAGASTAEALLKRAQGKDEQTEAHAYVGLELLGSGRTEEAKPHLQWVVTEGNREFSEYDVVVAVLKRQVPPSWNVDSRLAAFTGHRSLHDPSTFATHLFALE